MSFITGRAAVVVACSRSEPALFGARIFTTASSFCPWKDPAGSSAPIPMPMPMLMPIPMPIPMPLPPLPPRSFPGGGTNRAREGRARRTHNDVSRSYGDSGTWNFLRPTPRHETRGRYSSDKGSRLNLAKLVPVPLPLSNLYRHRYTVSLSSILFIYFFSSFSRHLSSRTMTRVDDGRVKLSSRGG